jgi:hypothetical protein
MRLAHAFSFAAAVAAVLVSVASCGGKVVIDHGGTTGTGGSSTTTTTTSTGSGGGTCVAPAGDCATDADCNGGTCAPLADGGYRVCLDVIPEATSCTPPHNGTNECCTSADCQAGKCYSTGVFPSCGGPAVPIFNACLVDQCTSDDDCPVTNGVPSQACFPAGAYEDPLRACYPAYCHTDADCTAQPCGACVPVVGPCCSVPAGLGCVYPGGCHTNADCATGTVCELDPKTGTGTCFSPMGGVCPN